MTIPPPRPRRRKPLDAGPFAPEIGSFRLHLAAEGKASKTGRTYTEAVQWFAAGPPAPGDRPHQLGTGRQAGHPAVDRAAAGPVQQRVRQQPAPRPPAVLQVAGRRGRDPRPHGRAEAAPRPRQARPGLHRRGPAAAGARLRGPRVRGAPRRRPDRRVPGDRDPPVGAGRNPVRRRRPGARRRGPVAPGDHRPRQGPQDQDRQRSATTPPAASTGTSASAPGTPRRTGRSCGSGPATGVR